MGANGLLGYAKRITLYAGRDGRLLAKEEKVDAKNHGEQVAKTLAELGIAKRGK
jgi:hypothetical protein